MHKIPISIVLVIIGLTAYGVPVMAAPAMRMNPSSSETAYATEHFLHGHPGPGSTPAKVIHIQALDGMRFRPERITVERGETVKFVVTNVGKLVHEFVIGDAALQTAHEKEMQAHPGMQMQDVNGVTILPGQTKDLVWTFTRDGVTEYACHEPGHFAAGMVGKIIIHSSAHD